ncbi:MAG: 50S ribosomal protein L24 [Chloroflexi bacterium]|nr:50S ribosomal protein L24 [Chloroflexota bacterium]MBI4504460.1 50S ribosomal protein L24 [Chloroflexota bacterium]
MARQRPAEPARATKLRIRRDDTVEVLRGKDRGKRGKVHKAMPREGKVLVSGVNIAKKHVRARPGLRQAGIIQQEMPLHASKVALVCPKCSQATRVGYRVVGEAAGRKKERYCKTCNEAV